MRRAISLICFLALVAVGCTQDVTPSGDGNGTQDDVLTIVLEDLYSEQRDPYTARISDKVYMSLMYDWLIGANPDGEFDNDLGLAEDWEYSDDGLTWTVTVRDGVTFWDGSPLTVEDVEFSLDRVLSDVASSSGASTLQGVIESTEITGENTMQVNLSEPYLFLPYLLSRLGSTDGVVISKTHCEEEGPERCAAQPMGSGPYELATHDAGAAFRFQAVGGHWRLPDPEYTRIEFLKRPEQLTREAMLERGEADIVQILHQSADDLEDRQEAFNILEIPADYNINLIYHEQWKSDNPLSDERIRRAMDIAIDREALNDNILFGYGALAGVGHLGPSHIGFDPDRAPPYEYDPDEARSLLDEAGYTDEPVQIDVYSHNDLAPELPTIMEAILGYWQAVGLQVRLVPSEFGSFRDEWGAFELGASVSGLSTDDRPVYPVELVWGSNGGLSYAQDPELDELIEAWNNAPSIEDAEDVLGNIMAYVNEHHISGPLLSVGKLYASELSQWPGMDGKFPGELYLDGLLAG